MYQAKVICDSISETGKRLTTFEITFPRIVLAEFNTHRMFSRNSASSRAIPFDKQVRRVMENPFIPEQFPINISGMQPKQVIAKDDKEYNGMKERWLEICRKSLLNAHALHEGLSLDGLDGKQRIHKQLVNRLLEPFMWHTVIVTATEFDNFFKLRTNEQAQWEIRRIADLMYNLYHGTRDNPINIKGENFVPTYETRELKVGEWHLPFISEEDNELVEEYLQERSILETRIELAKNKDGYEYEHDAAYDEILKRISVARCARVSYLTHDGKRDIEKDLELFERLRTSGHWSPFEHVATPYYQNFTDFSQRIKSSKDNSPLEMSNLLGGMREGFSVSSDFRSVNLKSGNFIGWKQFRKEFQDENYTHFRK
jgi:thymidylate synthase ThyX